MVDPLSIAGVVYPIARDLFDLAKKLEKIREGVLRAKRDLRKVIKRTEIVARTYDFFSETMKNVNQITELASIFDRHGELIDIVESECRKIIGRLKKLTRIFRFLMRKKSAPFFDKCIAQFEWYQENKETVPTIFQDMKILEKSMRTIGTLANTHLLLQAYKRHESDELILSQM